MHLTKVRLINFRNHIDYFLEFSRNINIIYGNNGVGKTNLLESIYFLLIGKSHRSYIDTALINKDKKGALVEGCFFIKGYNFKRKIEVLKTTKNLFIDDKKINSLAKYIEDSSVVIFYPEDLNFFKGGPANRRRFINLLLSQLDRKYFSCLQEYNNILKMRNEYLKRSYDNLVIDEDYLSALNNHFLEKAFYIIKKRREIIEILNKRINEVYKKISGLNLEINYVSSIDNYDIDSQLKKMNNRINVEKKLGTTLIGPHRDDLLFVLEKNDIRKFGSQGQQRLAIIVAKLVEIELFDLYKNDKPILLLDDIFSELDKNIRNNLLSYLAKDVQVIITTTDLTNIDNKILEKGNLIEIK